MNLNCVLSLTLLPSLYVVLVMVTECVQFGVTQNPDPLFELPVQLIGFPVIVLSVRLSQFAKKLAYSLNPNTYHSRSKRDIALLAHDADVAQKEILREFGLRACVLEKPCRVHASRGSPHYSNLHPNWPQVFRNYKVQSTGTKQWYLLSVFIGDAVRDVPLCRLLAKRMPCPNAGPLPPPKPR